MLEKLPDGNYRRKLDIIPYKQSQLGLDKTPVEKEPPSQVSLFSYVNFKLLFQVSLKGPNFMVHFHLVNTRFTVTARQVVIIYVVIRKIGKF